MNGMRIIFARRAVAVAIHFCMLLKLLPIWSCVLLEGHFALSALLSFRLRGSCEGKWSLGAIKYSLCEELVFLIFLLVNKLEEQDDRRRN